MYANLFFLILILLIVNFSQETTLDIIDLTPLQVCLIVLGIYGALLGLLSWQSCVLPKKGWSSSHITLIANCEILLFFIAYHFFFAFPRLFELLPTLLRGQFFSSFFCLSLYFFALYWNHSAYKKRAHRAANLPSPSEQIRFLVPFILPFLLLAAFANILEELPTSVTEMLSPKNDPLLNLGITIGGLIVALIAMMIFLPPLIQRIWLCTPLEDPSLEKRLRLLCLKANFKHAGIKMWTIMNRTITAAILGIAPRYRYVIFTKGLLNILNEEELEAVLAHEIGHTYHRHFFLYPFIFLGMGVATALFSQFFTEDSMNWLHLQNDHNAFVFWKSLISLVDFVFYALFLWIYLRVVFGFFSRQFERQADLYVFRLQMNPHFLINALNKIAIASGNIHEQPSWHHYSIQQRIDMLNEAAQNPQIIARHHARTKYAIVGYFCLLFVGIIVITLL